MQITVNTEYTIADQIIATLKLAERKIAQVILSNTSSAEIFVNEDDHLSLPVVNAYHLLALTLNHN